MFGIGYADWAAIATYLVIVTAAGLWAGRQVTGMRDFVMPRTFGKLFMMMHSFGTATHSDQAVTVASKCYTSGLSGIWYQLQWLFATPFFWLIAPMMRRFRALTTGDVFAARYDQSVAGLYAVLGLAKFMVNIGLMLKGSAVVIDAATGGQLPTDITILIITVLFVVYGLAGGLTAAIVTDFIQGLLTIVFSFLLLPLVLNAVGGLAGMKARLIEQHPGEDMMSLVAPGDIGIFFIFMVAFNALLGVAVQPQNMGTCAAGKTEAEGAIGFMGGTMIKRVCTVAWSLTGLAALAYYGGAIAEPDLIYGQVARDFLPVGLLGLFIAALLATVMGSCDSFMVASSGLVTENLYRPLCPNKPDKHYLAVARGAGLVAVLGGVGLAYLAEGVIPLLENLWKINTMLAMAFWLGIFWRRTTVAGAWTATVGALLTWWLTTLPTVTGAMSEFQLLVDWGVVKSKDGIWTVFLPWQMLMYIIGGFAAGMVASLFTRPVPDEKLERFYNLLRTSVQPDEEIAKSCTLPEGVEPGPRHVFFPDSSWEIPVPSRKALLGLAAGWGCVLAIIAVVAFWIAD